MNENFKVVVPILIIGFNRPDMLSQVLENIKKCNPQKLYITIDGPREGNDEDAVNVEKVKRIVKEIDFCPCVNYRFNSENKGCEITESSGISWVLEKEESVIVLEDDIIAHKSFFRFVQEMLEKYKNCPQIAMVAGLNPTPCRLPNDEDYCFCRSGHIGGWGTWRRAWEQYDLYEEIDDKYLEDTFIRSISVSKSHAKHLKRLLLRLKSNGVGNNTWDYMYSYYRMKNQMLSIVPRSNLTSNIGVYGLHARGETVTHYMKIDDDYVAKNHPNKIIWNKDFDLYHFNKWIRPSKKLRIKQFTKRILQTIHVIPVKQ